MTYILITLATILLIYIFLSASSFKNDRRMEDFLSYDYAHRGFFNNQSNAPENSTKAIDLAVKRGYGIEFDIRLTKDDKIVVFHDDSLKRMCGEDINIRNLTYEDLRSKKLLQSNQKIPLFRDILTKVDGKVPLIIELKCKNEDVDILARKAARLLDKYDGSFMVESFNPLAIRWFKKNRKNYIRGQLSGGNFGGESKLQSFFLSNLLVNFLSRPNFIAYDHEYTHKLSLKIQKYLWKSTMVAYTIKTKKDYKEKENFYDIIIFEGFKPN